MVAIGGRAVGNVGLMQSTTEQLWALQDRHQGDRLRLFSAVADAVPAEHVLYPGSFVDVAASFVFGSVTYVDSDRRAARFFADSTGVMEIVGAHRRQGDVPVVEFVAGDYQSVLDIDDESVDLLVSLYAGFVSEYCTRYLRVGGHLLVNPSHGDAALASIDPRYRLAGVVKTLPANRYRVDTDALDTYLVPKRSVELTSEMLHQLGRGIGYTRSAFAYLFERVK